ncbi:putative sugar kinase YdjH [Planctomycetes bacterium Poly30]|uniref:Putative sugar kinase YdjH n=1 Tax=Saltatorellus ferox TaxID=2528018 RepID=A0A518EZ19_9BACT|nr:putative sugar kinase YdjH [Planctomycetes bacterium Poly30]
MSASPLVMCYGEACVDYVASGVTQLPKWGRSHAIRSLKRYAGGNGLNCTIALATIGVTTPVPVLKLGGDADAEYIRQNLIEAGVTNRCIELGLITDPQMVTPSVVVMVQDREPADRAFLHSNPYPERDYSGKSTPSITELDGALDGIEERVRFHHFSGVGHFDALTNSRIGMIVQKIRDRCSDAVITADTVPVKALETRSLRESIKYFLEQVDYFLPSDVEAQMLTGKPALDFSEQALRLQLLYGCRNVIIKRNSAGVFCRGESGGEWIADSFPVRKVVDSTGAGDAWCAGFISALAKGQSLEDACRIGNAAGHFCLGNEGPSMGRESYADLESLVVRVEPNHRSVFISYARESSEVMHDASKSLEDLGVQCYTDVRNMQIGQIYTQIKKMIQSADAVLLIIDEESRKSAYVAAELEIAMAEKKEILPIGMKRYRDEFFSGSPVWVWVRDNFHFHELKSGGLSKGMAEVANKLQGRAKK